MAPGATRRTRLIALANAAVHVVGLALTATVMRPGTLLAPRADRMRFLAETPWEWTLGWSVWAACALAIAALIGSLLADTRAPLLKAALGVTVAAAAVDLYCDFLWIARVPHDFDRWEPTAYLGGAVVANGLYTFGVLLAAIALRGRVPPVVGWLAAGVVACGIALSVTSAAGATTLVVLSTGGVIGLYSVWGVAVAYTLR